jgi:hypothetical protein
MTQAYYNKSNLVITGVNLNTNQRVEVSTLVTAHEAHKYINQEFGLHKKMPCNTGLYGEYKDIRLTSKRL